MGEDHYLYKIQVQDTGITEYYKLNEKLEPDTVAEMWLEDVASGDFGIERLSKVFEERVIVKPLWKDKTSDKQEAEEPIPLPPAPLEEGEVEEEERGHQSR